MTLVIAVLVVAVLGVNGAFSSTVEVYKASDMALDWWGAGTTATGTVTAGKLQSVKLEKEDKIAKVFVRAGQVVKKGDKLFEYDVRDIDFQIKSASVQLESATNAVRIAQTELKAMQSTVPGKGTHEQPNDATLNTAVSTDMIPYAGEGTKASPYRFNLASGAMLGSDYINALTEKRDTDLYQLLEYHSGNKISGELLYQIRLVFYTEGTFDFSVAQFDLSSGSIITDYSKYNRSQLNDLITNKKAEIRTLQADRAIAAAKLNAVQSKRTNSVVKASFTGKVTILREETVARNSGKPFLEVLGDNGLFVSGALNEFELGEVKVGTSVELIGSNNKVLGTAKVTDISQYPDTSKSSDRESTLSVANTNASYYPFTAKLDKGSKLRVGDKVTVSFDKSNTTSVYILSAFVAQGDSGNTFVYCADEQGTLRKVPVDIGNIVYGEYTEITAGITKDSCLAFPYGKTAKPGARTKLGSVTDLLSGAL